MHLRKSAAVAFAAVLLISGCGGGGDGDSGSGSDSAIPDKDVAEIGKISENLKIAAADGDGNALCAAVEPRLIKKSFPSDAKCAREAKKAFGSGAFSDLEIEKITGSPTEAKVTYKNGQPEELNFVKENGRWYIGESGSAAPAATPD